VCSDIIIESYEESEASPFCNHWKAYAPGTTQIRFSIAEYPACDGAAAGFD